MKQTQIGRIRQLTAKIALLRNLTENTINMKPTGNPHAMPMPSNAPWKSESMPWSMTAAMQNSVMQFSAPNLVSEPFYRRTINHHKRKSELIPPLPHKQYISEEKITAHFSGMHISSNFTGHSGPSTSNEASIMEYDFNNPITQKELEEKLKNANRITVCDEIKKMHAAHSSFMPNALVNRIERPCTALVLWQPPPKLEDLVPSKGRSNNNSIDFEEDDDYEHGEDNNNTTSRDRNNVDCPPVDGMDTDL